MSERTWQVRQHEERRRVAHVLHEDLQQVLFGAQMAHSLGHAERLGGILDEALTLMRTLSHELSPPFLEGETFEDLLRWLAEQAKERYGLGVEVEAGPDVPVPDTALRVLLYQLLRELLFNVAKHAGTDRARVVVERVASGSDGHVRVVVADEGAGFDPAALQEDGSTGLGLPSVRERLDLVGGHLDVASAPGRGTRVTVTMPVGGATAEGVS